MIRPSKLPDQHNEHFFQLNVFYKPKTQPFSPKFKNLSAKLGDFLAKLGDFLAKLKKFSAKLKVSENPVTSVAAKWLKKQG